jgi:hypothetical protein
MGFELFVYTVASALGVAVGWAARWLPASGKFALAVGLLLPPAGVGMAMAFC